METLRSRAGSGRRACGGRPPCVVPATAGLARRLAGSLAPEHEREVRELSRLAPVAAVELSLAASREAYAVLSPAGTPLFMMGVEPAGLVARAAMVWMLAAENARRHGSRIMRAARWGLARAFTLTGAETLVQFIPGWYRVGRSFALRLGFTLSPLPGRDAFLAALSHSDFSHRSSVLTTKGITNGSRNHKHP